MTIPLLISVAVAGASTLFPPKEQKGSSAPPTSSFAGGLVAFPGLIGNQLFLAGVVMGMGLSWLLSAELHRNRLHDRARLAILEWLKPLLTSSEEDTSIDNPPTGTVFPLAPQNDSGQSNAVSTLVSPSNSLTSNLWVSTIHIPPQQELQLQKANGLEFFYVLQGKGQWDMQPRREESGANGKPLVQGDAFVVEANSSRWIANASKLEDLVLVRSSDAGFGHRQKGYDRIVPQSASTGMLSTSVSAAVKQAGDYFSSFFGSS